MLEVSVSGYYAWKGSSAVAADTQTRLAGRRDRAGAQDSAATYGARRVTAELRYGRGITVGHNQVELIMGRLGLHGLPKRRLPKGREARQGELA